jgi:hypothetical protein
VKAIEGSSLSGGWVARGAQHDDGTCDVCPATVIYGTQIQIDLWHSQRLFLMHKCARFMNLNPLTTDRPQICAAMHHPPNPRTAELGVELADESTDRHEDRNGRRFVGRRWPGAVHLVHLGPPFLNTLLLAPPPSPHSHSFYLISKGAPSCIYQSDRDLKEGSQFIPVILTTKTPPINRPPINT